VNLPAVAILSDLDGTLIDSKASVVAAFRWWALLRGLASDPVGRIPFGRTSTDAAAVLAPHLDAVTEGALLDLQQEEDTRGVVALDGAHELLLSHQPLAVVTSCPRRLALARLRAAGLPEPRHLLTPENWTHGKPNPEPYLRGAEALQVAAAECVVLEDAPSGVQSGYRAGMRVIGILSSYTREHLSEASVCIGSLRELPSALAALGIR
jgi:sugar-phosphatase